jgi:diacylglycerol kinase family enzyme
MSPAPDERDRIGLDRADPSVALEALTDGVELRVDLGFAGERVFVNNVSFGAYAALVQDPAYRDDRSGRRLGSSLISWSATKVGSSWYAQG